MNKKLKELYNQDQSDRMAGSAGTINWNIVNSNDTKRRNIVIDMYKKDEINYHGLKVVVCCFFE